MKKQSILLAFTLALALAGCSGGENSITGSFDFVLSGQIVAAGNLAADASYLSAQSVTMFGAPVMGVEVRAKGTGVAAVSDAMGRFSLMGLPGSVELSFTRSDGINASARVDVASNPIVTVELQKNQATIIPNGQAKREVGGTITAISPTSITVIDSDTKSPVTAEITSSTVIRHGNQVLQTSNLKVGDHVHLRALDTGGGYLALEIMLQNSGSGPAISQLEGLILNVTCSEINVNDASRGPTTAAITGQTTIRKGNRAIPCGDLRNGWRVHVKTTTGSSGTLTAVEIMVQNN